MNYSIGQMNVEIKVDPDVIEEDQDLDHIPENLDQDLILIIEVEEEEIVEIINQKEDTPLTLLDLTHHDLSLVDQDLTIKNKVEMNLDLSQDSNFIITIS